jgi:hypothetical protein
VRYDLPLTAAHHKFQIQFGDQSYRKVSELHHILEGSIIGVANHVSIGGALKCGKGLPLEDIPINNQNKKYTETRSGGLPRSNVLRVCTIKHVIEVSISTSNATLQAIRDPLKYSGKRSTHTSDSEWTISLWLTRRGLPSCTRTLLIAQEWRHAGGGGGRDDGDEEKYY